MPRIELESEEIIVLGFFDFFALDADGKRGSFVLSLTGDGRFETETGCKMDFFTVLIMIGW